MSLEEGLFTRRPTTPQDWLGSLAEATALIEYQSKVGLTFESGRGYDIGVCFTPADLVRSVPKINIDPTVAFSRTSPNFRYLTLAHEIGHIKYTVDSPLDIRYILW